jgi:hypothetical protein
MASVQTTVCRLEDSFVTRMAVSRTILVLGSKDLPGVKWNVRGLSSHNARQVASFSMQWFEVGSTKVPGRTDAAVVVKAS